MDHIRSSVQPTKELPQIVTKKEIAAMYPHYNKEYLYKFINTELAEFEDKPIKNFTRKRIITKIQWKHLVEKVLGYPKGYENFFR